MPEYLSPGVYVEEIDAGPKPIEGVSTSTTGAVGVTALGPTDGKPVLVTSFAEFTRTFGGFLDEPEPTVKRRWETRGEGGQWWQFPLSVKGFFDNGGQRLYIKRVFSKKGAASAQLTLGTGVISELIGNVKADDTTIRVRHILGVPNVGSGTKVKIYASGKPLATQFEVKAYRPDGTLTLDQKVGQELVAGRDWVEIVARATVPDPNPGDPPKTLKVFARAMGDWGGSDNPDSPNSSLHGNGVSVRIRPVVGQTLTILNDPNNGGAATTETSSADIAVGVKNVSLGMQTTLAKDDVVTINDRSFRVTAAPTQGANAQITIDTPLAAKVNAGTEIIRAAAPGKPELREKTTSDAAAAATQLTLGVKTGFANGDAITIGAGGQAVKVAAAPAQGALSTIVLDDSPAADAPLPAGASVQRRRTANKFDSAAPANNVDTIRARNAGQLYRGAIVELDTGSTKQVTTVSTVTGDVVTFNDKLSAAYHEGDRIRVVEAELGVRYMRDGKVEAQESFSNLKIVDDGTLDYLVSAVNDENQGSKLVRLEAGDGFGPTGLADFPSVPPASGGKPEVQWAGLSGGKDGLDLLNVDDFVGEDGGSGKRTGIAALEDIEDLSLCLVPGIWSSTVHAALITQCESLRYRFAIVDPPDGLDVEGIRGFREPYDTKYAALYHPWLVVRDPSADRDVNLAPSAHMAGLYARVDVERGVHKAPANEVVRSITKFAQDVNKREQDLLNPKNINALRFFPGRGNRVWGARVLTSDASWKYVNVRRLFIFVEASIDAGTQWVVFEPNDETLWSRVRQTITIFLEGLWRNGMLFGAKASDAFFVKCDRSTMRADDILNGRLICQVGIAPVRPAEFVIFRIQQKTIEANEG